MQVACVAAAVNSQENSSPTVSLEQVLENNSFSLAECMWQVLRQADLLSIDLQHQDEAYPAYAWGEKVCTEESADSSSKLDRLKAALTIIQHQHPEAVSSILHVIDSLQQDELAARAAEGTSCYWIHVECGTYLSSKLPARAIVLAIHSKLATDSLKLRAYIIDAAGFPTSQTYNSPTQFESLTDKKGWKKPKDSFTILIEGDRKPLAASKESQPRQFRLQCLLEAISSLTLETEPNGARQQEVNAASGKPERRRRRRSRTSTSATNDSNYSYKAGDEQCQKASSNRRSGSVGTTYVGDVSSSVKVGVGSNLVAIKTKVEGAIQLLGEVRSELNVDAVSFKQALQCQDSNAIMVKRKLREVFSLALHLDTMCS